VRTILTDAITSRTTTIRARGHSLAAGVAIVTLVMFGLVAAPATADTPSAPAWTISSISTPTNFAPGSSGNTLELIATNMGGAPTSEATTVTDSLPVGLTATSIKGVTSSVHEALTCTLATLSCTLAGPLLPGDLISVYIIVTTSNAAPPTVTNSATVTGGGALSTSTSQPTTVSSLPAGFGIQSFTASANNADGSLATQAGAVPYAATASFALNTVATSNGLIEPAQNLRDTMVDLPPGFVGNPLAVPRCAPSDFPACARETQVGQATVKFANVNATEGNFQDHTVVVPVYNMLPPPGTPAEFKFVVAFGSATLDARLRSGSDYGVSIDTKDISEATDSGGLAYVSVTLWGVPGDPSHDVERGRECIISGCGTDSPAPFNAPVKRFLTNPTLCGPPLTTTFTVDPWQDPGNYVGAASTTPTGVTGCGKLSFTPSISIQPESSVADSPTGLHVDLHVPQNDEPTALAEPDLKKAVVTLPDGVTVNPASAGGLASCTPAQIDLSGPAAATCPDASKIGSVEVDTPLVDHPLAGAVYLAQQNQNPFNSLLAIYIVVDDPASGVIVKLAGHVVLDPQTGQLTTTFDNNPQLPFEDLKLDFFGGSRAPLVTPETCGTFDTTSELSPWSAADPNNPTRAEMSLSSDPFEIRSGCVNSFTPSFSGGTVNSAAGAFTPFSAVFSRSDQDQELGSITARTPPGLLAKIAGVPLCNEPQAAAGTCSPASQIGHVTVAAGAGTSPVSLPESSKPQDPVYLTGPYKGAPFGLSVVVPAEAGPFNLGAVVVRAAIYVDPHTAQVTIVSDPLPQILHGVRLKVRKIDVTVDRQGFMLNPTSCDPMSVDANLTSADGVAAVLSSRFQAASCSSLPFNPAFSAATAGNGNVHGASLDVKVAQRPGEAAIGKVDTQLPLALPSRLSTLQKACPEAQFAANPAGCSSGSDVGVATATTPILNVPLTGPAYLVSHGSASFPDLDLVLQGEGVTIILTGRTDIKKGITYSRFDAVPDAPIGSFELKLPAGPGALLAATKRLCSLSKTATASKRVSHRVRGRAVSVVRKFKRAVAEPLLMPTTITGQNGAVIHQMTKIVVTGCTRPRRRASHRLAFPAATRVASSLPRKGRSAK
jgi:hypothetical protein